MCSESENRVHLHFDDHPQALAILATLFGHRVARAGEVGYEPTEHGAWVDWAALEHSWLSSTECAAVVVARGIAMAERHSGWPPGLHQVVLEAVSHTATSDANR
jgi:hypothetical protein